jgi:replicative superfamily II helicase
MKRNEYYNEIEESINRTLNGGKFNNHIKQMFAWRIGARFERQYDEEYVWRRVLFLSSNACKILKFDNNNNTALRALKISAEVYEYLSEITEIYDKDYCFILSALCYDISGYQANALCMMRLLLKRSENQFYSVFSEEEINVSLEDENYILYHIQQILLKQIPVVFYSQKRSEVDNNNSEDILGMYLFDKAIFGLYSHIIKGQENTFLEDINETYCYYLSKGNVFISHLLYLLSCRFYRYDERSIWNKINPINQNNVAVWTKYIKLLTNDFYDNFRIKDLNKRRSIFEFWISQLRAVEQGVLKNDESFIIQMPTSAGKTFIAEIAILEKLTAFPNKKCIYVAPFNALTNEKETELSLTLSKLGYSVSSLLGGYEVDEFQNFIIETTDVLVATPEKLDLLYRLQTAYFEKVSLLVIDEGHIIGDLNERASLLEFLIIRLKNKLPNLKILFISAVMPTENGIEFSFWLSGKNSNIINSPNHINNEEWQPTRKLIGKFEWFKNTDGSKITYSNIDLNNKQKPFVSNLIRSKKYGRRIFPKKSNKGQTAIALAYELSQKGNTLIFCSKPNWAESVAKQFLYLIETHIKANEELLIPFNQDNTDSISYYVCKKWLGINHIITKCIKRGVGVHYGDLPKPVRKSIEKDYKSGVLKILISTNTIGQGLNFPIKNLIIHSLDLGRGNAIKVRDFWNIIGRAGRAGKETEGQIIFLSMDEKDDSKFDKYIDKNNINKVESIFTLLLKLRNNLSIDELIFQEYLEEFSEPFLLSMLAEEIIETNDEDIVENIIGQSLFNIQTLDIDITPIRTGFKKIVQRIKDDINDKNRLNAFASNGFNIKSNETIEDYISNNLENLKIIVENDDYKKMLIEVLKSFDNINIKEIQFKDKLEELNGSASTLDSFLLSWIEGNDIDTVFQEWDKVVSQVYKDKSKRKMFVFLSKGITFRYPWGTTAFLTILAHQLETPLNDLPKNIQSLSSFLKNGLNNRMACFALSLGLNSRDLAVFVADKYNRLFPDNDNYKTFLEWLSNLTFNEINLWKINKIEKENINDIALKFSNKKIKDDLSKDIEFRIRGTYFSEETRKNSLNVSLKDRLIYKREFNNEYDPFAISLFDKEKNLLGYIPRDYAKPLSVEIDLNDGVFLIEVIDIQSNESFNEIYVNLKESL